MIRSPRSDIQCHILRILTTSLYKIWVIHYIFHDDVGNSFPLKNILLQKPFKSIKGIAYKEKNKIKINPPQELIENLDSLPMPDYSVFNIKEYHTPRINCKKNPIAAIETSRGCVYNCIYCNNKVFGRCFQHKNSQRRHPQLDAKGFKGKDCQRSY